MVQNRGTKQTPWEHVQNKRNPRRMKPKTWKMEEVIVWLGFLLYLDQEFSFLVGSTHYKLALKGCHMVPTIGFYKNAPKGVQNT